MRPLPATQITVSKLWMNVLLYSIYSSFHGFHSLSTWRQNKLNKYLKTLKSIYRFRLIDNDLLSTTYQRTLHLAQCSETVKTVGVAGAGAGWGPYTISKITEFITLSAIIMVTKITITSMFCEWLIHCFNFHNHLHTSTINKSNKYIFSAQAT